MILDSHLRLSLDSRLVQSTADVRTNDLLVFCSSTSEKPSREKRAKLEQMGVRVETVSGRADERLDLYSVLRRLARLEITSVMIEGGSTVNGAALDSGAVDKVFLYYAPTILGGSAIPFAARSGVEAPIRLAKVQTHFFGDDFAIEGYLRDPYAE